MARIIVDAGVIMAWLFDEDPGTAPLQRILDRSELIAPWLWRLEVTNAVLVRERRKMLSEAQASRILQLIDELAIDLVPEPTLRTATRLAQTARPHQLSAYDAVYLELAITNDLPLFTRDNNLRTAAQRVGVALVKERKP